METVFPYGFVVRRVGNNTTRELPDSPDNDQFDGVIDFGFSIPLTGDPANDPTSLSVFMLAVDDSETRLTQGLQQQNPTDQAALLQRASSLGADSVMLLPGGSLPGFSGGLRTLCSIRTAGFSTSPTAYLVNFPDFQSFSPTPNSVIPANADFQATFTGPVQGIGPSNFTVRGSQSGLAFRDTIYSGNGTNVITTPQGSFLAGEQVEITLTGPCPQPRAAQYSVQGGGTGSFNPDTTYGVGTNPWGLAIGDLNGDGNLDLAATSNFAGDVSILLNNGNGTFPATGNPTYSAGGGPWSVAIGDLNGDGSLDLAVANLSSDNVSVLLNNGGGTFPATGNPTYDTGSSPRSVAIGDLNADGSLDLAVADYNSDDVSVLLNNGNGTFPTTGNPTFGARMTPNTIAIGDLNGDGSLDLAVTNFNSVNVSVLLGQMP